MAIIKKREVAFGTSSLKNRLWILQISLVAAIISGIIIVLILTGTFKMLDSQSFTLLNSELERTGLSISRRFITISQNTYELSKKINKSINRSLEERGLTISDLKTHPEVLEALLDREVEKAVFTMQKSNCSGVFVILDAPLPEEYYRLFYLVGINEEGQMSISESIHLDEYSERFISAQPNFLTSTFKIIQKEKFKNYYFDYDKNNPVVGLETKLNIYSSKSVFKNAQWVLVALLPPDDVAKTKAVFLFIGIVLLFLVGISIAYYISRFYTKPISLVLRQIIEGENNVDKTNIIEIDDLIEFLKQDQVRNWKELVKMNFLQVRCRF